MAVLVLDNEFMQLKSEDTDDLRKQLKLEERANTNQWTDQRDPRTNQRDLREKSFTFQSNTAPSRAVSFHAL